MWVSHVSDDLQLKTVIIMLPPNNGIPSPLAVTWSRSEARHMLPQSNGILSSLAGRRSQSEARHSGLMPATHVQITD